MLDDKDYQIMIKRSISTVITLNRQDHRRINRCVRETGVTSRLGNRNQYFSPRSDILNNKGERASERSFLSVCTCTNTGLGNSGPVPVEILWVRNLGSSLFAGVNAVCLKSITFINKYSFTEYAFTIRDNFVYTSAYSFKYSRVCCVLTRLFWGDLFSQSLYLG